MMENNNETSVFTGDLDFPVNVSMVSLSFTKGDLRLQALNVGFFFS